MPALDGLRALAVAAVIVYHGEVGFLRGGFIGVDLFFVLSGFLITSLLLAEHRSVGSIDLRRFWVRRFRRLLPALLVYLSAVAVWAALAADPHSLAEIRQESLAGLGYVANWFLIASGAIYGASLSAPSPVLHLWSLSVEEQYYVLWPLIATGLFAVAVARRCSTRALFAIVGTLAAVGSTLWMGLLASRGASPDRMYFGTDTRVATILVGVVLAALLQPVVSTRSSSVGETTRWRKRLAWLLGSVGGVVLIMVALSVGEQDRWLYQGGFTVVAIACAAVIAAMVLHPGSDRLLGSAPLRWMGTRSYGLYLWHLGVLVGLAVGFPQFTGWSRLVVASVLSGIAAELSYRIVEHPIRSGALVIPKPRVAVPGLFILTATLLVLATRGAESEPEYLQERPIDDIEMVAPPSSIARQETATTVPAPLLRPSRVALVGDSVAASLSPALAKEFAALGMAYADASAPGCGVLDGDPADENGQPLSITKACSAAIPVRQNDVIRQTHPDLVVVLSTWEAGERVLDGQWHPFASPEGDARLLRLYGRMVDRLSSGGARVALVTVPDTVPSQRGPAKSDTIRRSRHLNELLARVVAADPKRTSLVRLDDIVCPADPCPTVVDGVELRALDGAHFAEPEAAALVAKRLAPRISQVGRGA